LIVDNPHLKGEDIKRHTGPEGPVFFWRAS